ncbi:uncharacterized protein METZ01_LOCUS312700 [marine metagenome]|uniref:Uncharacterized protein n=1 Tax=marine metagenome TaxID=408172 RepID=A0A382NFK8_9ZZZZ
MQNQEMSTPRYDRSVSLLALRIMGATDASKVGLGYGGAEVS